MDSTEAHEYLQRAYRIEGLMWRDDLPDAEGVYTRQISAFDLPGQRFVGSFVGRHTDRKIAGGLAAQAYFEALKKNEEEMDEA